MSALGQCACVAFAFGLSVSLALGELVQIVEVEGSKIICDAGTEPATSLWASGGRLAPDSWGRHAGDRVECSFVIPDEAGAGLSLSVRYAYDAQRYRKANGEESAGRLLQLVIDGRAEQAIPLHVPDTGGWGAFRLSTVRLNNLGPGRHTFALISPERHMATNLDCLVLHRGGPQRLPAGLRSTVLAPCPPATPTGSAPAEAPAEPLFVIRLTAGVEPRMSPEQICTEFRRICTHYRDFMGWDPPRGFGIHLVERDRWPSPNASAFQNDEGVFFRAEAMHADQGNWCHEMVHMFYVGHFPGWFDESSVRTLTIFDFMPALYPERLAELNDRIYRESQEAGRRFLDNAGETTDDVAVVQYAVRLKYGPELFRRFFHLCRAAWEAKELDFTPGRRMTKDEICRYMSKAAGEDVRPLYARWTGFADVP